MRKCCISKFIFSSTTVLSVGICMIIVLIGGLAIVFQKIKIRTISSSAIQPEQHQHNQGFNTQAGNATIVNVIGIIYVTIALASIIAPTLLLTQNFISPHPFFMVNNWYGLIYVPSLVVPITFAIIWPKSIKIGIQAFPCCN
jgi:hypothetical protein